MKRRKRRRRTWEGVKSRGDNPVRRGEENPVRRRRGREVLTWKWRKRRKRGRGKQVAGRGVLYGRGGKGGKRKEERPLIGSEVFICMSIPLSFLLFVP